MTESVLKKIHLLGHSSLRIDAGKIIYIDPFELPADAVKADIVLITHEHYDHYSAVDLEIIATPATHVVTIASVAGQIALEHVHTVKPGDTITVEGIEIEAVLAYNVNKKFHPRTAGHVGYIVTVDGKRIYHAGDTDLIPEMADFDVDIAVLPVSGTYVMTAEEAIEAAERIAPEIAVPMHYGSIVGDISDAEQFVAGCTMKTAILPKE